MHKLFWVALRMFGDGWAVFLVTDSLVQDQPDQSTLSMGNRPSGLIMSEARDRAAIDNLEDTRMVKILVVPAAPRMNLTSSTGS